MSATTLSPPSSAFRTRRRSDAPSTDAESNTRRSRLPGALAVLWTVIGLLVIAALAALVMGPARGMRTDIAAQRATVAAQLETTRQQLDVTRAQLQVTEQQLALTNEQLEITKDQRRIALEQLEVARTQLDVARAQLGRTDESLEIQRRLAVVAEQTLQQVREINEKTPDGQPADAAPTANL